MFFRVFLRFGFNYFKPPGQGGGGGWAKVDTGMYRCSGYNFRFNKSHSGIFYFFHYSIPHRVKFCLIIYTWYKQKKIKAKIVSKIIFENQWKNDFLALLFLSFICGAGGRLFLVGYQFLSVNPSEGIIFQVTKSHVGPILKNPSALKVQLYLQGD